MAEMEKRCRKKEAEVEVMRGRIRHVGERYLAMEQAMKGVYGS